MSIVSRVAAVKHLRALKRADSCDPGTLREAQDKLVESGASVISPLLDLLRETHARTAASETLERLLSSETLPVFIGALDSDTPVIARGVTKILCESDRYDPTALLEHLDAPASARSRLDEVLRARGDRIPARNAVPYLSGGDREVRTLAFRLLEAHGDPSIVGDLLPLLDDEEWWLRLHALKLIGRHPDDKANSGVAARLSDDNRHVRLEAVKTLGQLEARDAIPALCNSLRDPNLHVHSAAIDVLIQLGDASAVKHLVDVLKDESEYARRGAVEVLNEVATTEAVSDLVGALRDEDWWVRVRAADALGTLGGEKVVEAVLGLMSSDDEFIRRYAVEILNTVPDERAVDPLVQALEDPDWWVRERSIDALAGTGDPRAVEPLIAMMERDARAAPLCAQALGTLADERAVAPLCGLANTANPELREQVRAALQTLAQGELSAENVDKIQNACADVLRPAAIPTIAVQMKKGFGPDAGRAEPAREARDPFGSAADGPPPAPVDAPAPKPAAPVRVDALYEGDMLLDRYRVIRPVGSGGFGSVILVLDTAVDEELILKVLNPQISADEANLKRFVQELKYTRRITHKHVIRIHDLLDLGGVHAISMEYFAGRDLGTMFQEEERLPVDRGLHIAIQICEGLVAAHTEGIVHRDIKPPNILVNDSDFVKIVDFGLASMSQYAGSRLTKSGILIGTPHYMAPEQITGAEVDGRTDVYSLGVLLYEMFAGALPVTGDNAVALLFQHLEGDVKPLCEAAPHVPEAVGTLVAQAMAKEPDDRPESAEALLALLRQAAE